VRNLPTKLSPVERDQLLSLIGQGLTPGPKSAEIRRNWLEDLSGMQHQLGGFRQGVEIDHNGLPVVFNDQQGRVLDCGHVITSLSEVGGMCSHGHILCKRHNLYRCGECRKTLCELEMEVEDGVPVCPGGHAETGWVAVALIVLILFIGIKSCG